MVRRALRRGSVQPVIERTLGIVQQAGSADCLLRAVGPDVIARMKKALGAARKALPEGSPLPADRECCG
jgi:hypothetical protein